VIVTHRNPDGDAVGSSLALYRVLTKMGHKAQVITPNVYPEFLHWLPDNEQVLIYEKKKREAQKFMEEASVIFCLDFNDITRIREFRKLIENSNAYKVMIDHHPNPVLFADCTISDISVSSTSELLYQFFRELQLVNLVDSETAACIYAGIMTDTGAFSYNSSREQTFLIVAELLGYGFDKDKVHSLVYDNFSADRMRFLGYCLNEKMKVFPDFGAAYISITQEERDRFNFQPGDSEGFVNYPLSINGIRFTALFLEKKDHVKISFRSKGDFAVNRFSAKYFDGGGHKNAAGGESKLSLEETLRKFESLLPEYSEDLMKNDD
jgi:bifunctional oligoribonuclease and PAP phosphatase NrnA